jgi:CRISPR system Cascade subunit CasE
VYLSKVTLNWPACRNPYQWHRLLWQLFPDRPELKRDYLFACIGRRPGRNIAVLLFSFEKPTVDKTIGNCLLLEEPKSIEKISFSIGQRLQFRLTANPTKVVTEQTRPKRKIRVPLIKADQQGAWLQRHLNDWAEIETVIAQNEPPLFFNRNGSGGKIVPVLFEGVLKVINPEKFRENIYTKQSETGEFIAGIGPAKSFGCGLMLIKPL